jgi:hypothetical protein
VSEKSIPQVSSFLELPDDEFMLALCVRPENLKEPAKWCEEMRAHTSAMKVGPSSVQESEQMMETAIRLAEESAGLRPQKALQSESATGEA